MAGVNTEHNALPDDPEAAVSGNDQRTLLAADRTLLAWIRTGLAMMGFGFVVARFGLFLRELEVRIGGVHQHSTGVSLAIGIVLVSLGVVVNLSAAWQHAALRRAVTGSSSSGPRWSLGTLCAIALALVGAGLGVYLILL